MPLPANHAADSLAPRMLLGRRSPFPVERIGDRQEFLVTRREHYQQFARAEHQQFVKARVAFLRSLGRQARPWKAGGSMRGGSWRSLQFDFPRDPGKYRTSGTVRLDPPGTYIAVSNTSPYLRRYDGIPRDCLGSSVPFGLLAHRTEVRIWARGGCQGGLTTEPKDLEP